MGKLGDVYSSVENPIDNEEILKNIVEAYSKSNRTSLLGSSNLYSSLVKMNQTKDSSQINLDDREAFMVEAYNQWIENMLKLDDAHIQYLEKSRGMDAKQMQQYLRGFGKVSSMDDIKRLKSNPLFEEEVNGWELQDGWEHTKSQYISGRTENRIQVKHRLYVGCQNQDMWKLAQLFKSKCQEQQIPFYFKLGSSSERDDKMVIYADTDNLENYISALQEIAQEHPEIMQRCGEPPALTGKIDGWIGIGDEPPLKANGKNQSYNSLRADIFENAIEEAVLNELREFKGKDVTFNGKQTKFNDLFMEQAAQFILEKLDENKDRFETQLPKLGLKDADLTNDKFKEHIKTHLRKNIQKGIDKLVDVKDQKAELCGSNSQEIFAIPTREGKKISVNTLDMDSIIKRMVPIMQQIDPTFMDKVKSQIQEKCKQNGIDDTFCFQQGTKERFEQMDSTQPTKVTKNAQTLQNPENMKKETAKPVEKVDKSKKITEISSIDIVQILNPSLLKQKISLPNGVKIPARQYIQEIVAPHIPSDGKFILNNGSKVSATQYIEEYILGKGQEKYNGDINALLEAMTVANNGTVSVGTKSKPPRSQALQQEMGTSSTKDEKLAEPSESKKAKLDSETLSIQSVKHDIKHDISEKRITSTEVNQYQHQIADRDEMKRLMLMGKNRTEEQQRRFEQLQHIYHTNQNQVNQQQKNTGIGIER